MKLIGVPFFTLLVHAADIADFFLWLFLIDANGGFGRRWQLGCKQVIDDIEAGFFSLSLFGGGFVKELFEEVVDAIKISEWRYSETNVWVHLGMLFIIYYLFESRSM